MAKKMEQVIADARAQGLAVRYRKVKEDGWTRIRVISIDGEFFSKSKGNTELRRRMGESLSVAETRSRKEANVGVDGVSSATGYQRARHKRLPKGTPKLTKVERREIAKVNRLVKKTGKGARISYRGARLLKGRMGQGAIVDEAKKHYVMALGLATPAKIEDFLGYLKGIESKLKPGMISIVKLIRMANRLVYHRYGLVYARKKVGIKHDDLVFVWKLMYDYEKEENPDVQKAVLASALTYLKANIIEM